MDYTNPNEVMSVCKGIAHRFKSKSHHDDLVSVGILAIYEAVSKGMKDPRSLKQEAKKRMHDHLNIKTNILSIPVTAETRKAARNPHRQKQEDFENDIVRALESTSETLDDNLVGETSGLDKETSFSLNSVINKSLPWLNSRVIKMYYYDKYTQKEIAQVIDKTQYFVSRLLEDSLILIKNTLGDNK
jgi:RNA polymerase sigma factor (sigma-70 family)